MISFQEVSKYYPNRCALSNITLDIPTGEMLFITGHSGAGKTTLLKLIMLIEQCSQGQIFLDGQNLLRVKKRHIPLLRQDIGMVFQNPRLIESRSIFDNVALPLMIKGLQPREIKKRVRAALDKVGLLKQELLYPRALSLGEQQRVGIARAVVHKPKILLADEPTGNLDPILSEDILNLFSAFNAVGTTVVIATHDLTLIARLPYRIITLKKGELLHVASPAREYNNEKI